MSQETNIELVSLGRGSIESLGFESQEELEVVLNQLMQIVENKVQ